MREMGEQGFLGCTSDEYGLPGVSSVAYGKLNKAKYMIKRWVIAHFTQQ